MIGWVSDSWSLAIHRKLIESLRAGNAIVSICILGEIMGFRSGDSQFTFIGAGRSPSCACSIEQADFPSLKNYTDDYLRTS